MNPLSEWLVFYQIVGSAAGALTGLQFIVMALIADMPMRSGDNEAGEAFASPTIVHFVAVLMLAASLVMPWHSFGLPSIVWDVGGLSGLVYTLLALRRMLRQDAYKPVLEDWIFHTVFPLCAYSGLTASALLIHSHARGALFGMAGTALLLLFVGIHNAWDNILFLVTLKRERLQNPPASS